jgi:hypothetical protein
MNKRYLVLVALVACLAGCVPVDSLNPLYTDKEIVFDESLLGEWIGMDPSATAGLKFIKEGKDGYEIAILDDGPNGEPKTTFYDAHLLNLSGQKFLDVQSQEWSASQAAYPLHIAETKGKQKIEPRLLKLGESAYMEFAAEGESATVVAQLRNAHRFFKVKSDGKKLHLDWIDDDKLKAAVAKGTVRVGNALISPGQAKGWPADAKNANAKNANANQDIVLTGSTADLQKFVTEHMNDDKVFTEHAEMQRRP